MSMEQLRDYAARLRQLRETKESAEAALSEVNKEIEDLSQRKIPELMENLQLKNATFDGIGRVQLASDLYASTREGQKEAAIQWLTDVGLEGLVTRTYNASSLKAVFRRMLVEGTDIPEEIFNVTPFVRASVVKV